MIDKGRIYCGQIQDVWGTAETDITGSNFLEVNDDSTFNIINENDDNPTVSGGTGLNPVIIGSMRVESQLNFNVRSFGVTVPDWATMAQSGGWAVATDTGVHTLTLASIVGTQKDATIWEYNGGRLKKSANMMFDWEIGGEINKKCVFSLLSGKGILTELPSSASSPSVTKSGAYTPAILPVTKTILGSAVYSPLSFKFMGKNTIEQYVSGDSFGYGKSRITNRELGFELQVYGEIPSVVDPYTAMRAGGESAITLLFGKTGEQIRITTSSANIKDISESKSGNIIVFDISGIITDDDLTIVVNYSE